jgi:hypothetical protein
MSNSIWPKAKFLLSASFLSLVIGLVALYYTVRRTRTNLVVDVTSESNVMDVRTPRKDLSILFQGQDIQRENSNLRIVGVRLVNEGDTNVLESYFDSRIPWGLRIDGGRLIEARVTGSSSQYLSENLHPKVSRSDEVDFDKVIFDRGKYVALELLVLHDKNVEPQIRAVGKIAGMDAIPIRNSFRERDQEGFGTKVFKGPIAVQIARTIAYFLIGLGTVIVVGLAIAGVGSIPSSIRKRSRRKWVRYLPKEGSPEKEKERQALLDIFVEDGLRGLKRVQRTFDNEGLMAKAFGARRVSVEEAADFGPALITHTHRSPDGRYFYSTPPLESLVEAGLVRRVDKTLEVDPEARQLLSNLISQLSEFDQERDDLPKAKSARSELENDKG